MIVLTARDGLGEKVRLPGLGANDDVVKPFHPGELTARIRVHLRPLHAPRLMLGNLEVNLARWLARWRGQDLRLSFKAFGLLSLWMREPGQIYTRPEIPEALREGTLPDSNRVIDVRMANLREKLRQQGAYRVPRTVRGLGYAVRASGAGGRPGPGPVPA